ncbi:hypothetical protein L6164_016428 [Bauhinia variegata]|uniref:Uncharacterized protein n=1 Tax=Bauhinia variegata TaxID=167791 RepID=A0ACB9NPX8_BAUVA|nr:hypothetical protein L6164_016428 [Bauhinia variegata]
MREEREFYLKFSHLLQSQPNKITLKKITLWHSPYTLFLLFFYQIPSSSHALLLDFLFFFTLFSLPQGTRGSLELSQSDSGSIAENKLASKMVPAAAPAPVVIKENWVSCDLCLKWRLLPLDAKPDQLPENWSCSMLFWVPGMNRCEIPEEETTNVMRDLYQILISEGQSNMQNRKTGSAIGVSSVGAGSCVTHDSNAGLIVQNKLALEMVPTGATAPLVIEENWVSCDHCLKWRLLPLNTKPDQVPKNWSCSMLYWVPGMNRCEIPEEETTNVMRSFYERMDQSDMQNHAAGIATEVSSVDSRPSQKDDSNSVIIAENKLASEVVPAAAAAPLVIEENWVSCDSCLKWRLLPLDKKPDELPEKWLCCMLYWMPGMNRCEIPEEETTNVMRSFYQRILSEHQDVLNSHRLSRILKS